VSTLASFNKLWNENWRTSLARAGKPGKHYWKFKPVLFLGRYDFVPLYMD
jgi:hypothetical protein